MQVWVYTLISVTVVSLLSLIGIFFMALDRKGLTRILLFQVSFAVGALFGDVFFHLLPDAFRKSGSGPLVSLYVLLGIMVFFVLEKFVKWRHCHIPASTRHLHPMVMGNFIGEGAHNFTDGVLIGASYCVSPTLGVTTTLAVILHEIPHEIGNFGVYVYCGLSVRKALLYNFVSALTAIVGAVFSIFMGEHLKFYSEALVPITAGGFIYIAGSDLIPELHHEVKMSKSIVQLFCIILGIGMMALFLLFE